MKTTRKKTVDARSVLEAIVGPLTFGSYLGAIREGEHATLESFAKKLGVSRANLCDIEKGRQFVSLSLAVKIARKCKLPEVIAVKAALMDQIRRAKLKMVVEVIESDEAA